MNTPHTSTPQLGHAAAIQALFPGGVAVIDAASARAHIEQFLAADSAAQKGTQASSSFMLSKATPVDYEMRPGGVARIAWGGPMQQRPHPLLRSFLGYVATDEIASAVQAAAADPQARSIMLVVDSSGGAITGVAELAAIVSEAASSKPVVAVTDGLLASAAYWAASGASAIYGTGPTVSVGSIGAAMIHVYSPRTDGAVVTEITAGKYKRVGSSARPLTNEDLSHLQEKVDFLTQQFVNVVAANRGLSASAVAAQEGRTYIGQQAVDAGLLDGLMRESELERRLAADPGRFMRRRPGAAAGTPTPAKALGASSATTWPPKLQPVIAAPVTPTSVLEQAGQAEEDMRADAAEIVRMHKLTTTRWPKVMTWKAWEQQGAARARKDGCTLVEGMKREGYLHPYVSLPDSPKRGTPGVAPSLQLTKQQMAERAAAWSQFKGIGVVEACKWLGLKY